MNLDKSLMFAILAWVLVFANSILAVGLAKVPYSPEALIWLVNYLIIVPFVVAYGTFNILYKEDD